MYTALFLYLRTYLRPAHMQDPILRGHRRIHHHDHHSIHHNSHDHLSIHHDSHDHLSIHHHYINHQVDSDQNMRRCYVSHTFTKSSFK